MKVLVADDDRVTRLILRHNITRWGYEVEEVEDGEEALARLTGADPPRIAVLDWMMPKLDGVQVCERMQSHGGPLVYAILVTRRDERGDMVQALERGAYDYLGKPVNPDELRSRIAVGRRLIDAEDALKRTLEEVQRLATIDDLTGLANRRHFFALSEAELERNDRYPRPISALMVDVDHFKRINDGHSHAAGDETLRVVGRVFRQYLRQVDIIGRLGGEEFAALLPETDAAAALYAAERLRRAMAEVEVEAGQGATLHFTVSIGVSTLSPGQRLASLLSQADAALYRAKRGGRDRVEAF